MPNCLLATLALAAGLSAQQTLYTVFGQSSEARLGSAVSRVGDVDGDDLDDFVIGAPGDATNGVDSGAAFVISGADGTTRLLSLFGDNVGDAFGAAVAGAGDVDGDGLCDVAVGAPTDDDAGIDSGRVRVYSGTGALLYTFDGFASGDAFGYDIDGAGDVNGDGYDDILIGAPQSSPNGALSGGAIVRSGRDGSVLHAFLGISPGDLFGIAVAGAGDVNDDGYDDVVIGAIGDDTGGTNAGSATVFSGVDGTVLHTFVGASPGVCMGCDVARAGYVDADRNSDIVVGIRFGTGSVARSGAVEVYSGATGNTLHSFRGTLLLGYFGTAVAGGGDVDGDGADDIVVGEHFAEGNAIDSGVVFVFSGRDGSLLMLLFGDSTGDLLGTSVAMIGDVDGDDFDEVIAGAPLSDAGASNGGLARVYRSGETGDPAYVRDRGAGCPSSNGHLPRNWVKDRTVVDTTVLIELRGASPGVTAFLNIGFRTTIDLSPLGAVGCAAYATVLLSASTTVDGAGFGGVLFTIPNVPNAIGANVHTQWLIFDPGANRVGLAASNGMFFTIGA